MVNFLPDFYISVIPFFFPLQEEAMREFEAIATDPAFQISHRLAPGEVRMCCSSRSSLLLTVSTAQ